ncbi:MAG TPA: DUF975 family protein [Bacilli bacterium]|nr:DUF975 family protein [Bacilli bacterium]HPL55793.1 DUF975 family protein [Bacilli bacterium]
MFCKNCGKEINDKSKFCQFCGEQVAENENTKADQLRSFHYEKREYNRAALKQEAKNVLKKNNNFFKMIAVFLLVSFISGLLSLTIVGSIVALLLYASIFWVNKNLLISEKVEFELLYKPIDDFDYALRIIGASLLVGLLVLLGTILLIVPGIIIGLMYSQTIRIIADDKNISISDAMAKSKALMDGHKMELFIFGLSFIGHILLIPITLGLWTFYFVPYYQASSANYYFYLRGLEQKTVDEITTF